ncbi:MAG: helix-turn-helix transcriptional regulator [Bacteriovoracaceae bacterium]|nr:helix-turn-helix transcriptional regulator [Bacteriovoracaceae bacterium]
MISVPDREEMIQNLDLFFGISAQPIGVGETIKRLRELSLFTQDDLASLSGISKSHISDYESERREVTKRASMRLAPALGVHPGDILFPKNISFDNAAIRKKRNKLMEKKAYFASIS